MTAFQEMEAKRKAVKHLLSTAQFPSDKETILCWTIGHGLGVTGVTVKNYLRGKIKDGYLADAIYSEIKRLKLTK